MKNKVYIVSLNFESKTNNIIAIEGKGSEEVTTQYVIDMYLSQGATSVEILSIEEAPTDVVEEFRGHQELNKRSLN